MIRGVAALRDVDNMRRRTVNIERIRRMVRWSPTATLEERLARTASWLAESQFMEAVPDPISRPWGGRPIPRWHARP